MAHILKKDGYDLPRGARFMELRNKIPFIIKKISSSVYWTAKILGILLMILMVFSLSAGVISRYVFNHPIFWTDEFSRIVLIWTIFIGAALAFRKDTFIEHIAMDFVVSRFPRRVKEITDKIIWGISILVCIAILLVGASFLVQTISIPTAALEISRGFIYAALPISAVMSLIFLLDSRSHKQNIEGKI